jgi:hypothetical protein
MSRVLGGSQGGGRFLIGKEPLYLHQGPWGVPGWRMRNSRGGGGEKRVGVVYVVGMWEACRLIRGEGD